MTDGKLGQREKGWRRKSLGLGIWCGEGRELVRERSPKSITKELCWRFFKFIFNWRIVAFQGCAGFCHTTA